MVQLRGHAPGVGRRTRVVGAVGLKSPQALLEVLQRRGRGEAREAEGAVADKVVVVVGLEAAVGRAALCAVEEVVLGEGVVLGLGPAAVEAGKTGGALETAAKRVVRGQW